MPVWLLPLTANIKFLVFESLETITGPKSLTPTHCILRNLLSWLYASCSSRPRVDPDLEIWQFAKTNGFIIVTKDSDFEEISILKGTPPKVIWIRTGNAQNHAILDVLLKNKKQIDNAFSQEEIGCIELYE